MKDFGKFEEGSISSAGFCRFTDSFFEDIVHELRTPLAVMIAQCEYSKRGMQSEEELRKAIGLIYRQAKKMDFAIKQIYRLNRLIHGEDTICMESADLDEIIRSVCEDEEYKHGEDLEFKLSLQVSKAYVDINLMTILIRNLVNNAVKYSIQEKHQDKKEGRLAGGGKAIVEISSYHKGERVFVRVRDYGCGISTEDIPKIFQPFYRAAPGKRLEGLGLGLSIAGRIAQIHRGEIYVESMQGCGTTFTLMFPGSY